MIIGKGKFKYSLEKNIIYNFKGIDIERKFYFNEIVFLLFNQTKMG